MGGVQSPPDLHSPTKCFLVILGIINMQQVGVLPVGYVVKSPSPRKALCVLCWAMRWRFVENLGFELWFSQQQSWPWEGEGCEVWIRWDQGKVSSWGRLWDPGTSRVVAKLWLRRAF